MKLKNALLFITLLTTGTVFSETCSSLNPYVNIGVKGTLYKKTQENEGVTETSTHGIVMPTIGFGIRRMEQKFATDISIDGSWKENHSSHHWDYAYTLPKVMFLRYAFPENSTPLFFGLGGSWAGLDIDHNRFHGLFGNASVGVAFRRFQKVNGSIQLDLDVPAIAVSYRGNHHPYPLAAIKVGFGF